MTRPIAKPANVKARTRRRQVSPSLLRAALVLALAASCAFAVPVVLGALRPAQSADGAGLPPVQVALSGLAAGACMSLSPSGSNAGKTVFIDPAVGGTETFYDAARKFAAENKRLAVDLQAAVVSGLGTTDRGVWTDDQLAAPTLTASGSTYGHLIELGPAATGWVDSPSEMPGVLIEPMFLTNPAEARLAADPAGQQRVASVMRAGLQKYFSGA